MNIRDDFKSAGQQYAAELSAKKQAAQLEESKRKSQRQENAVSFAAWLEKSPAMQPEEPPTDSSQDDNFAESFSAFIRSQH